MQADWRIYSKAFHDPPGEPLRIGAPDYPWVNILTTGLENQQYVDLVRMSHERIREDLESGALDCGLLPPLDAAAVPFARVIPGIAICTEGPSPCQQLWSRVPLNALERVRVAPGAASASALLRVAVAVEFGHTIDLILDDGDAPADGYLELAGHGSTESGYEERTDLSAWWTEHTGLPFVHCLWVGRHRAPYPRLRKVLSDAAHAGSESAPAPPGVYTNLGSAEMDGVRLFLELAKEHGLCPQEAALQLC